MKNGKEMGNKEKGNMNYDGEETRKEKKRNRKKKGKEESGGRSRKEGAGDGRRRENRCVIQKHIKNEKSRW